MVPFYATVTFSKQEIDVCIKAHKMNTLTTVLFLLIKVVPNALQNLSVFKHSKITAYPARDPKTDQPAVHVAFQCLSDGSSCSGATSSILIIGGIWSSRPD